MNRKEMKQTCEEADALNPVSTDAAFQILQNSRRTQLTNNNTEVAVSPEKVDQVLYHTRARSE